MSVITPAVLELLEQGGWTKAKVKLLGLSYPLHKGWKHDVLGQWVDMKKLQPLLPGSDKDRDKRRAKLKESFDLVSDNVPTRENTDQAYRVKPF